MALNGTVTFERFSVYKGSRDTQTMASNIENGTVSRKPYADCRPREYLTGKEITELMNVARKRGRYGQRDPTMILLAYRHGFRSSELCALRWDQVGLDQGLVHIHRVKQGVPSVHPLRGPELRALRKLISRIGELSRIEFSVHPHMLRHACGYKHLLWSSPEGWWTSTSKTHLLTNPNMPR